MSEITDADLLAAIKAEEANALGSEFDQVSTDRADALNRYFGRPYGNEVAGRSSAISRDVSDVVEGVTANVVKPFVSGDKVVQFDPRGPDDVDRATQETDYVNFVALERNNGFLTLTSSVKDALLLRAGYIKCAWTRRDDVALESYERLSDDELAMLLQDKELELVAHSEYPDPLFVPDVVAVQQAMQTGQPIEATNLHDAKFRRASPTEFVETLPVPPDELLVSQRTREPSLQQADFVQHRTHKTLSELRQLGYEIPDEINDQDDGETLEEYARQRFGKMDMDDETSDPSRRRVLFKETWLRIDRDGDGIAELRRVCSVGETLLADDEADLIPVACFSPLITPHQHLGVSLYDMIQDVAQIRTVILRNYLDNLYINNNQQYIVDADRVNIDDFLISRPGGIKRVQGDPMTAVAPVAVTQTGAVALQGLEVMGEMMENRTGYTRAAAGMDADSLAGKTATGYVQQLSQSQMRLEMISRTIAETGVRDLFRIIHALTLKHSTKAEKIRLNNKWVEINPREWVRRTDLSISVGLGSSTQAQQLQNLMLLAQAQEKAMPLGLVKPKNVYALLEKLANAAGFKNPEAFFAAPPDGPQQEPPPKPDPAVLAAQEQGKALIAAEQVKAQTAMQKHQTVDATEERKAVIAAEADLKIARAKSAVEGAKVGLDAQQQDHEQKMDRMDLFGEMLGQIAARLAAFAEEQSAPREIVRDNAGRAIGVRIGKSAPRAIVRDENGRANGLGGAL